MMQRYKDIYPQGGARTDRVRCCSCHIWCDRSDQLLYIQHGPGGSGGDYGISACDHRICGLYHPAEEDIFLGKTGEEYGSEDVDTESI